MKKMRLDVHALEVTTYEPVAAASAGPQQRETGLTGACNTCWACHWTV